MTAPTDDALCRSTSPDGDACTKPRGHRKRWHHFTAPVGSRSVPRRWEGGVNTPARWERVDDGYMSEGEAQVMRNVFGRWA